MWNISSFTVYWRKETASFGTSGCSRQLKWEIVWLEIEWEENFSNFVVIIKTECIILCVLNKHCNALLNKKIYLFVIFWQWIYISHLGHGYGIQNWSKLDCTLHSHQTAQFFIIFTYVCRRTVQGQLYLHSELQANLSPLFKKKKKRISALSKQRNNVSE